MCEIGESGVFSMFSELDFLVVLERFSGGSSTSDATRRGQILTPKDGQGKQNNNGNNSSILFSRLAQKYISG